MEYSVKYLIGYPGWNSKMDVKIKIMKGTVRIYQPFSGKDVVIDAKNIVDVSFDAKSKRSGARAATGALIGGVLTGGIGLLAGAAIGASAKDKSELNLFFNENGIERQMLLLTKGDTNAIYNEIVEAVAYANKNHVDEDAANQSLYAVKPELNMTPKEREAKQEEENGQAMAGCAIVLIIIFIIAVIVMAN